MCRPASEWQKRKRQGLARRGVVLAFLAVGTSMLAQAHVADAATDANETRPWRLVVAQLEQRRDRMGRDLATAHAALLRRVEVERPALAARLSPAPPAPLFSGYGVVPLLLADAGLRTIEPTERTYSLERLSAGYAEAFRDAALLALRAEAEPRLPLEQAVADHERLTARMRSLERQISYHDYWQAQIDARRAYFDGRNRIVERVRERERLRAAGGTAERIAGLDRTIRDQMRPFKPTPDLAIETRASEKTLAVVVATDVSDTGFLDVFRRAVEDAYNRSEPARAARFRIELTIEVILPEVLYPDGVPAHGAAVDLEAHLARFRAGALVLTTGARSIHSGVGRYIQLGAPAVAPRVLAHEFGHLLGFNDAYLRGYRGDPSNPFGVEIVEWTGLVDDLMGGPGIGRVSPAMIETLLAVYGRP